MTDKNRARRGRSEGSIYQRADGMWVASISLGIHGKKRQRRVVYAKTKTAVTAKLRALQLGSDAGQLPDAHTVTVEQWLQHWLQTAERAIEPNTLEPYERHVRKHLVPRIGGLRIQKLRPADVEALFARQLREGTSAAMVRKIATTLSIALNHAVRSRLIPSNPCQGVKRPRADQYAIEVLDASQVAIFIPACHGERWGPLFILLLDSAMRPGEALALTWRDVDFTGRRIAVTKSLEIIKGEFRVKEPKTAKSNRTIDLTAGAVDALTRHREAMRDEGQDVNHGRVFVKDDGTSPTFQFVQRVCLWPILRKAGLPLVSTYALRHTSATLLLAGNVNPKIVSERLGHSTIVLTLQTYSHVLPGMQSGAVDVLDRALQG